jgi:hydroxymethylglutaryl-CoA lyase
VLDAVSRCGVTRVEVASLSRATAWPQFADAVDVLSRYQRRPGVTYSAYVPNVRGLQRLLDVPRDGLAVDAVLVAIAASDSYNVKNVGRPLEVALDELLEVVREARAVGLDVVGCVGTAWACPIEGPVAEDRVLGLADRMLGAGAGEIVLGDTTGEADPVSARERISAVKQRFDVPLSGHFHDARGTALANAFAAVEAGVDGIEGSLGGVGGHPPDGDQPAPSPNLCTEDFLATASAAGWGLNVDLGAILEAGRAAERALGRTLLSRVQRNGLPERLRANRGRA